MNLRLSIVSDQNSSQKILALDQASLGMSREYLVKGFDDKYVQSYFTFMKESAVLLGAVESRFKDKFTSNKSVFTSESNFEVRLYFYCSNINKRLQNVNDISPYV